MIRALGWVLRRDLLLAFRRRGDVVNALVFFVIVVSLFPLGVGPEASQLRNMAPGVLWVAALLACMLSLARLFGPDHQDGTLEQMLLAFRRRGDVVNALVFFVIVVSLFPLGVGPEASQLRNMAPGVLWVAALLACMLSLARLFGPDHADGTLEQMLLAGEPLVVLVMGKVLAHWLMSGLPLVLMAPLLGLQFDLPGDALAVLCLSLLIGTPVLSLIGSVGAALTLGVRGSGVLVALLVLPLYVPVLIFGAGSVGATAAGTGAEAHLLLLGGFLALSLVLAPWASAAALRIAME